MQFNYDHLRALSAILRTGSFEMAAAELGVTAPAISQRLKALEDQVGARLVVRAAPCTGTDLGRKLARHMEDVAVMEAGLVAPDQAAARITLAVNADSLATWLIPALVQVPGALFDLRVVDQDRSAQLLKTGEVAAAVTSRAQPVQGCDVQPLGRLSYVATASPAFVDRWFSTGVTRSALEAAPALIYNRDDKLQATWAAREVGAPVRLTGHTVPSTTAFVHAAEEGLGWGMNPEILVRAPLRAGRLIAIGAQPAFETPLYWQFSRRLKTPLAALTRAIAQTANDVLEHA